MGKSDWWRGLGAACAALAVAGTAAAQVPTVAEAGAPAEFATATRTARAVIDSLMEARNLPGLSIAVSVRGETVWSEGFGYADLEQHSPVTPETKFRIGSVSKSLTAAALGQLYEQGRLDLDAPVQRYVPSFPAKTKGVVTPRLLAGHLAGVRHYAGEEFLRDTRYTTVDEGLAIFEDDTLLSAPGAAYHYSTYGWSLLSAVVEGASGEPFLAYMPKHVFRPLGMIHTVADHNDSIVVGRAGFYEHTEDGRLVNAPHVDNSYKWAGGGFLSTPEDLLRFANAHLAPGFLQPETVDLLWTSQRNASGEATGYGIGWNISDQGGVRVVSHSGGSVGGNTLLVILPDQGVVLAIVSNVSNAGYRDVPARIVRMFAGM